MRHYYINKLLILNRYEMLSLQGDRKLIIWNIDYENNILNIEKTLPLNATDIFGSNPIYGYFYLILDSNLLIIDKNYK